MVIATLYHATSIEKIEKWIDERITCNYLTVLFEDEWVRYLSTTNREIIYNFFLLDDTGNLCNRKMSRTDILFVPSILTKREREICSSIFMPMTNDRNFPIQWSSIIEYNEGDEN